MFKALRSASNYYGHSGSSNLILCVYTMTSNGRIQNDEMMLNVEIMDCDGCNEEIVVFKVRRSTKLLKLLQALKMMIGFDDIRNASDLMKDEIILDPSKSMADNTIKDGDTLQANIY